MRDLAELRISTICVVDGEILAGLRATRAPRPQATVACGPKSQSRAAQNHGDVFWGAVVG